MIRICIFATLTRKPAIQWWFSYKMTSPASIARGQFPAFDLHATLPPVTLLDPFHPTKTNHNPPTYPHTHTIQ